MEMWIILGVLIPTLIFEETLAITRLSSAKPYLVEEWRLNYERNYDRDSRSTDEYPSPQLPWEEALRHSIYLTLIRDKIDVLLTKDSNVENHEETDINLWRELRRAPFKAHKKERGPIFGDIAILSRGKLVETQHGLAFIEDENAKECIECHIYSARPNELEAEKKLGSSCKGADCENVNVKALWTVRRIRHRNHSDSKSPYRYELMFSIASAKSNHDNLDYNVPTQTFTIMETDRTVPMTNLYKKNKHSTFEEEFYKLHNEKKNAYEHYEPQTERSYWVHKNINDRKQTQKNTIHFPEYQNYQIYTRPDLNTGEIYTEQYQKGGQKQLNYYEDIFSQNIKSRGQKKFEKNDKVYLENVYHPKNHQPTITHLHHHYYLDDKGVPILKFTTESNNQYYDGHFVNANDEVVTPEIQSIPTPRKTNIFSTIPDDTPVSGTISNTRINMINITQSTRPITLQMTMANRLKLKPTKPFTPSHEDIKVRYSELDPLYPPTLSTPASYNTEAQILYKETNVYDNNKASESTFLPTITPEYSTKQNVIESSAIATNTLSTITSSRDYDKNIKNHKLDEEEVIAIPIEFSTKKISRSKQTTTTTTSSPIKLSGRKKPERPTRIPSRRNKLQKNFSELLNAQLPPPDKTTDTTLPYNVNPVTESFLGSETNNTLDAESKNKSNHTTRNTRQKYQRKYNTWSPRKIKTKIAEKKSDDNYDLLKIVDDRTQIENTTDVVMEMKNITNGYVTEDYPFDNYNQTVLAIADDVKPTTNLDIDSVQTSISYINTSRAEYEDVFMPQTKKSYVTSISFKLGNKTIPYYPMSTTPTKNETETNKNDTLIESILNEFDLSNAIKANVSQISDESDEEFKVYRTEDAVTDSDIDNITQQILNHAKSVNIAGNSTN